MEALNLLNDITTNVFERLINEDRTIVWFSGKRLLGVINDCLNILGGRIDYAIVDGDKLCESPVNYIWGIPLVNKNVSIDINNSPLLSKYHIQLNQPKAVDASIIDVLGKDALYVLSSKRTDEMTRILKGKGIGDDNILILASEDEAIRNSNERVLKKIKGRKCLSIDEIHETEFEILSHFKRFCEINNLRYWLGGGTMLGAVRHEGFIPWDDDVDVFMPDSDYYRFIDLYKDNDKYELLTYSKTKNYPFYFSKISDKHTMLWHHEFPVEYIMGVYIDIFPLVGYPDHEYERDIQWKIENITMSEWYWYKDISAIIGEERMPITAKSILDKMILPPFDGSPYVGQVSVIKQKQWVSRKEDFLGYVNRLFEKEEFRIPVGYDSHLRERYGDYMLLPPEEKREIHGFPMYR